MLEYFMDYCSINIKSSEIDITISGPIAMYKEFRTMLKSALIRNKIELFYCYVPIDPGIRILIHNLLSKEPL